jgi:hypothetical protein
MSRLDVKQIHHKSFQKTIKSNFAITIKKKEGKSVYGIERLQNPSMILPIKQGQFNFEARLVLSRTPNDPYEIVN